MASNPALPDPNDPIERWAKQGSLRGGAGATPGPQAVPGMDVSERPWNGVADSKSFLRQPTPTGYTPPPVNPTTGGYVSNEQVPRSSQGFQSGGGLRQGGPASGPRSIQGGGVGGGGSSPSLVGADPTKQVGLRAGLQAQPGVANKAGFLTSRAGGAINRGLIAPAKGLLASPWVAAPAALSAVVQNYNDYKIDDPSVDSSAQGTWSALRGGDFAGAGRSLSKGALETGMDLGSFAANTADYLVPGKAPVSTAYNKMLRNNFGDQLVDNSGASQDPAPSTQTSQRTPATQAPRLLNANTSRPELGASRDFSKELNGARGPLPTDLREGVVHKTTDAQGRVTYSGRNVGTPGGGPVQMVDGMGQTLRNRGSVEVAAPGSFTSDSKGNYAFTPSAATAEGRTTQKGEWDGKVAASKANRTALREQGPDFSNMPIRMAGQLMAAQMQGDVARRGQDMDYERAMAPMRYSAQQRQLAGELLKQTNGDLGAATKLAMRYGVDPTHLQSAWSTDTSNRTAEQSLGEKAAEQSKAAFKGLFDTTDTDGKVVARPDLEAQAHMTATRASGGKWNTLGPTERAAHVADAHSYVSLLDSARQHQNNGWMQMVGLSAPDSPWGGLPSPDQLAKSTMSDVGWIDSKTTPNVKFGDKMLTLPDGRKMYLGSNVSGEHLKYLADHGVKTGK